MVKFGIITSTIFIGLIIAGTYILLKRMILPRIPQSQYQDLLQPILILAEKMYWPIFIISVSISIILKQPLVGLSLSLFSAAALWKPIRNYLLGIVYFAGKTYFIGQRLRYNEHLVTLKAFHNISLEMELDDGESMNVPYNDFADATVIRSSPQSGVLSHSILLNIAKPCVLEKEEIQIKALLLSLPWVLPKQKIVFERLSEDANQYRIKVIVHGIDKNHLQKVEYKIKRKYQSSQVS